MYANGLGVVRDYIVAHMWTKFGPGEFSQSTDIRNLLQRNMGIVGGKDDPSADPGSHRVVAK